MVSQTKALSLIETITCSLKTKLEALGNRPYLKKKYFKKLIQINEILDLCDIWISRNASIKRNMLKGIASLINELKYLNKYDNLSFLMSLSFSKKYFSL